MATDQATTQADAQPGALTIGPAIVSQYEGTGATTDFAFTVTRAGDATGFTTVAFQVSGVGANPASADDIVGGFQSGNLTFGPGETSQILTISSKNDAVAEPDETFQVTLSSVGGSQIGQATATGTI